MHGMKHARESVIWVDNSLPAQLARAYRQFLLFEAREAQREEVYSQVLFGENRDAILDAIENERAERIHRAKLLHQRAKMRPISRDPLDYSLDFIDTLLENKASLENEGGMI